MISPSWRLRGRRSETTVSPARLHLRFWLLLGFLGLALLGGAWWCLDARGACLQAQGRLAARQRELDSLRRQWSGAAPRTLEQTAAELAQAEETRRTLRAALGGEEIPEGGTDEWKLPDDRTEAFIELSDFVGAFRECARALGVHIRPGERFGFATYAQTGPEPEFLPAVHRQRVVLQHLLKALLASQPMEIMAVQREHPRGWPGAGDGAGAEDFFEMDSARSSVAPGIADGIALRMKFTGFTPVLRDFMNRVQQDSLPLVVRSVEAEPAVNHALAGTESAATGPMFAPQVMQFTVTVEHVRLLAAETPES